jgi:chromosome segregation ATPase
MTDMRPDAPRYLHERGASAADATATVDVADLLSRLTERAEELAEARVSQKHAEANLRKKTREWDKERKARTEERQQLESDCRDLEIECSQIGTERRELEVELKREREARTAAEADLKRMQERIASLQHQLKIAWAQLQQGAPEAEPSQWWSRRPWWTRLGS